ncbi:MAG: peptidylprolyl isomerase [Candidatus Binataceae bacterium]
MRIARTVSAGLIAAIAAVLLIAPIAQSEQVVGGSGLEWQQRFLGILPLVKPDIKDPVVVTVDGVPITLGQIDDYARAESKLIGSASSGEDRAVWKDAMENLVNRELLLLEAKRRKLAVSDAEAAVRAREFDVSGGNGAPGGGAPDQQLIAAVRGSMEIEKLLDGEFRAHHVEPTEAQIKHYYGHHLDLFVKDPGWVRISHIAVKLPPNPTKAERAAALKKIRKLRAMALKTKDFAALAKKYSEDPESASKGGDLGTFTPGQLPPDVDKAVFSTPAGGLTTIFESDLGDSFIKVTARRAETYAPLSEVKAKIATVLQGYNEEDVVKAMLKKLAKPAKIKFERPPNAPDKSI